MSLKYLLTAKRIGSADVRTAYMSNALAMAMITGVCFLLWYLTSSWLFPEFNPFSYWDLGGDFWGNLLLVGGPAILYAIFLGQLDWFNDDRDESGTIISENMVFKGIVSFCAGLFEELSHRGILIWVGLIVIWVSNFLFMWVLALVLLSIYVLVANRIYSKLWKLIFLGLFIGIWLFIGQVFQNNPVHTINGLILGFYQWVVADMWRLGIIYFFMMLMMLSMTIELIKRSGRSMKMHPADFMLRILSFVALTAYVLPKAVAALSSLSILPPGADKWTVLLYIGAIMWSNVKFSEGHKYQGPSGTLHSYMIGFYMIYIAFTYGLLYAIVIHFLFDLFIFGSEHTVQILKNRRKPIFG